jgi:hypothetical protein
MWHITIMVDDGNFPTIREMPCWALETPERKELMDELGSSRDCFWAPEPALTLFHGYGETRPIELLRNVIDTVLEHHPRATTLELVGISASSELSAILLERDLVRAGEWEDGLRFQIPFDKIANVPELKMDARGWKGFDDLYDSFFAAVGAPVWHGRNFDALNDSIVGGGINRVDLPYVLVIENLDGTSAEGYVATQQFILFVRELEGKGCPISVIVCS